MFGDNGPRAWKTKKGHSRLETEAAAIASGQAKGEARASIDKVIAESKAAHETRTEAV